MDPDVRIQEMEIHDYARQLFDAHGARSVAEAADRARKFEARGDRTEAALWRRIEAALIAMRGPNES